VKAASALVLGAAAWSFAQDLGSDYSLGYLTGSSVNLMSAVDQYHGVSASAEQVGLRVGTADVWALDVPALFVTSRYGSNYASDYIRLPGGRLGLHPLPGLMLDGQLVSGNLWASLVSHGSDDDATTGFAASVPRILRTDLFGHYLSRDGRIALDEETTPFAFYYGPVLGEGQFEVKAKLRNTLIDTSDLRGYGIDFAYGIAPHAQAWISYQDSLHKNYRDYYSNYYGSYSVEERYQQQALALGGDWVSSHLRAGAQAVHGETNGSAAPSFSDIGKLDSWSFLGYGGFLGGGTAPTAAQAAGNWNGFFTSNLSKGEYDLEDSLSVYPTSDETIVLLRGSARYGVVEPLTVGLDYRFQFATSSSQEFLLNLALSNMARRTQGPSQVSAIEYQVGILPKQGEGRLLLQVRLPGSDGGTYGDYTALQRDPLTDYAATWDNHLRGWTRESDPVGTFRLDGVVGLADKVFLSGTATRVNHYRSVYSSGNYDVKDVMVYSIGLGLHFDRLLMEVLLPFYMGNGKYTYDSYDQKIAVDDNRFGPFQFQMVVNF